MSFPELRKKNVFNTLFDPNPAKPSLEQTFPPAPFESISDEHCDLAGILAPPAEEGELGRLAHYRVVAELGRGGMGVVFLAFDTRLQRMIALKVMLPSIACYREARERFLIEARAAAKIRHPNVVTIFHVGEEKHVPYMAMELLQGLTLSDYLEEQGELSISQAINIGRQVARGLRAVHAAGLVHRDIKPENIWLETPKGHVKILDFGLAHDELNENRLTQVGMIMGTPLYMSPEQANGQPIDRRSDLFSLGVLLYRLCTSQQPFVGSTVMATLCSLATHAPTPPRTLNARVPESLESLIMVLLAKNRESRILTAEEIDLALTAIRREQSQSTSNSSQFRMSPTPTTEPGADPNQPKPARLAEIVLERIYHDFHWSRREEWPLFPEPPRSRLNALYLAIALFLALLVLWSLLK